MVMKNNIILILNLIHILMMNSSSSKKNGNNWYNFNVTVKKCMYKLFNIVVIVKFALFLLVVKNLSGHKRINSS